MIPSYTQSQTVGTTVTPTDKVDNVGNLIGLPLGDARGFRLTISANSGVTLTGTGTMRCVMYHPALGRWCRNPDLDQPVGADAAGARDRTFPEVERALHDDVQVYYYPDAVGLSSGTALSMRLDRGEFR